MLDGMGRDEMRAADADRQSVADKLRAALDEGRLDLHEYDERLQQAYAAKTYGQLDGLLTDLPVPPPAAAPVVRHEHVTAQWLMSLWSSWGSAVAITTAIWLVSSIAAQEPLFFWPIWVAGPWGAILLWQTVTGLAVGEPRKLAEAREQKELAKQRERERKALAAERDEIPPAVPEQMTPEKAVPEQMTPEKAVPEQMIPDKASPERMMPEKAGPDAGQASGRSTD
jgi:hypothetical protein